MGSINFRNAAFILSFIILSCLATICVLSQHTLLGVLALILMVGLGGVYWISVGSVLSHLRRSISDLLETERKDDEKTSLLERVDHAINNMKNTIEQGYTLQILKKQAELEALQSQINPHFLYNALDSIRGHARRANMAEIADMTEAISTLFRYSISKKSSLCSVADEIENVRNYLKIQQYRFGDRIRFYTEIENSELLSYMLPKMTMQPVVENAVYHGLEAVVEGGVLTVYVEKVDDCLQITVQDNGVGIDDETLVRINDKLGAALDFFDGDLNGNTRGTGVALLNVSQRIKLYFGNEYGIHIFSTKGIGTDVVIRVPFVCANNL